MSTTPTTPDAWTVALQRVLVEPARLRVVLQPVVDLESGAVAGHEVLARFPEAPHVPVRAWFDAAARLGVSGALEAQVVRAALGVRPLLPPGTFAAVNLSPMALTSSDVADALEAVDLDGLVVDVLDRDDGAHPALVARALEGLQARGVALAVDDAGRTIGGYARVSAIRPTYVKVDGALVRGLVDDPLRGDLVLALGELAGRLGATLVAKGVETEAQRLRLRALGVRLAQGRLLGPPAAAPAGGPAPLAADPRAAGGAALAALAEPVPTATVDPAIVAAVLEATPTTTHVLTLDELGRPVVLVERAAHARGEAPGPVLVVRATVPLADAARRAMARAERSRFEPLVLVDAAGAGRTIVRIDRLVRALADAR